MNTPPTEYKILVIDLEVYKLTHEPHHILQCGAILFELRSRKELATLNTVDHGFVLPKRVKKDNTGLTLKPAESLTQEELYDILLPLFKQTNSLLFHNAVHDCKYLRESFETFGGDEELKLFDGLPKFCTMWDLKGVVGLTDPHGNPQKWLKLCEATHHYIEGKEYKFHDGFEDAKATMDVFLAAFDKGDIQLE
jgi:DNA polymerase III epsilon subunit-like protein